MKHLQWGRRRTPDLPRRENDKEILRWCRDVVAEVGAREPAMQSRSDDELRALTGSFRARLASGETLDDLLPEAFAAVREAAARALGQRHHDVQIMGGAVLHLGKIAEMRTGEGKTLTATLPGYLNALPGAGVHLLTANDYLARRDAEWMGPAYQFLGLRAGLLQPAQTPEESAVRKAEYGADVTYGPWEEFGYDYLRDNLAWDPWELVQRGHHFAIVDEADLILIDNADTPLGISGPAEQSRPWHADCARIAAQLEAGLHYDADPQSWTVSLTEAGARWVEEWLGLTSLYDEANLQLIHSLLNALKAKDLYRKDRDYIVDGDQAVVVDPQSGRPYPDRRYDKGQHEAIEAKEGLTIRPETQTLATVETWDYLGQYHRLCGMTGTAMPEAEAYRQAYRLDVVTIPTNRPMIRVDHPDAVYRTAALKLTALADETAARNATGQPVLIGTMSIAQSESISRLLTGRGIGHEALTAQNHQREAQIIADAARLGAVTIVAKMAGRGVDIILGGADSADDSTAEHDAVADRGGLCVLGAERSGSRRVELHLRGRAGRQGDPGEAKFFLSLEDDVVKAALGPTNVSLTNRTLREEGEHSKRLSAMIDSVQARTAASSAAWLMRQLSYEAVLADQRHVIYAERQAAFGKEGLPERIRRNIDKVIRAEVTAAYQQRPYADRLWRELRELYRVSITPEALARERGCDVAKLPPDFVAEQVAADAQRAYDRREAEVGAEVLRELERIVSLSIADRAWREHLPAMEELLQAIRVRSPGGAAPLPVYQREAALLFSALREAISKETVGSLFNITLETAG
jgi:preprotein translocase subunit SecA